MAYIGKSIESGTFSVLDTSGNTYNGSNVTFSLGTQVGSPAQLLVSHDGVLQKPGTDYTLATGGTQITFTTAPASGASIFIVEISGAVGGPLDSDLNGTELILDADADTSITADTDDQIDIKIAGADDFQFTANTFTAQSGSTIAGQAITATTVVGSGAAQFATAGVGSAKDLGAALHVRTADSGASALADADEVVIEGSGNAGLSILSATDGQGNICFGDSGDNDIGMIRYAHDGNAMKFYTNASEQMRIDSNGRVGIGCTASGTYLDLTGASTTDYLMVYRNVNDTATTHYSCAFKKNDDTTQGSITNNGNNSTSYNTSSDYRLKENEVNISDGITRLKQLKPYKFNWKSDSGGSKVDGFFAHEVSSIVPEAIVGEKDAMIPEVLYTADDELPEGKNIGDVKKATKINPQQIDQAKLVPLLTSALQEAITKIETLEAKVTTLEG